MPIPLLRPLHIPRGGVDPITCADDAIAVISAAVTQPLVPETIALLLDGDGIGQVIPIVTGTVHPGALLDVVELLAIAAADGPCITSVVLASVRPWAGTLPGDVCLWLEADAILDHHGLELIEWYVVGPAGIECPRELIGEPERW